MTRSQIVLVATIDRYAFGELVATAHRLGQVRTLQVADEGVYGVSEALQALADSTRDDRDGITTPGFADWPLIRSLLRIWRRRGWQDCTEQRKAHRP